MQEYQEQYVKNAAEIAILNDFYRHTEEGFETWYEKRRRADARMAVLQQENVRLLEDGLFPMLDNLHSASGEDIRALEEFSDALLDWKQNLDPGIYVLIHDALLSVYRVRRDREAIIRELYKLGMGLYYQYRVVEGIDEKITHTYHFQNEMVFTEGGSYLKYFASMENEETKGYIIRSMANVAIAAKDMRRKVAASARTLQVVNDPYYRELAPGLPWDTFLLRTNQQMSANRGILSRKGLNTEELAAVLEACHEVFEPEMAKPDPNIRWLWPYYEMEYTCGFADVETTRERLEKLIDLYPFDQYDLSGMYGNVQLPIYYGSLLRDNPGLLKDRHNVRFLDHAYRKMKQVILTCPVGEFDDFFFYLVRLVITDFFETEGVLGYREVMTPLMRRLTGGLYIRSRVNGEIMKILTEAVYDSQPEYFEEILQQLNTGDGSLYLVEKSTFSGDEGEVADTENTESNTGDGSLYSLEKTSSSGEEGKASHDPAKEVLLQYAQECGLYHDFGMIKMNMDRLNHTRNLLETEYQISKLHTISGHDDLAARKSTAVFADIALGHHAWYDGSGREGYPERYVRRDSPYRQMTDIAAVAAFLTDEFAMPEMTDSVNGENPAVIQATELIQKVLQGERRQFSPMITSYLTDPEIVNAIVTALTKDTRQYFREMYDNLMS